MSLLQTQIFPQAGNIIEFKFDGASSFEKIRQVINAVANDQNSTFKSSQCDQNNLKLLKKQLGMERQELMLKQIMTKNNDVVNNIVNQDITNNFNKQKYELVVKYNDMICIFLLYFIHECTWIKQPLVQQQVTNNAQNHQLIQNRILPTGIPYDIIYEKIKKVLPFLSNLFMELIEDKFPTGVAVQVSEYQDLQERLQQAQLLGKKMSTDAKKVKKLE